MKQPPTKSSRSVASQNRKLLGMGTRVQKDDEGNMIDANSFKVYAKIVEPDTTVEPRRMAAGKFLKFLPGILKSAPKDIRVHFQMELQALMQELLTEAMFKDKAFSQYMTVMIREHTTAFIALARLMSLMGDHVKDEMVKHPFTVNLETILMLKSRCAHLNLKELCMGLLICGRTDPEPTQTVTPPLNNCVECSYFVAHNPLLNEVGRDAIRDATAQGPKRPGRCGGVVSFVAMLAFLRKLLCETVKKNADVARADGRVDERFGDDPAYRTDAKSTVNNICNCILYFANCFRDIGRTAEKTEHLSVCSLLARLAPKRPGGASRWAPWDLVRAIDLGMGTLVERTSSDERAVRLLLSSKAKKNVGTAMFRSVELPFKATPMREKLEELALATKRGLNLQAAAATKRVKAAATKRVKAAATTRVKAAATKRVRQAAAPQFEFALIGQSSSGLSKNLRKFTKGMFGGKGGLTPYAIRYQGARDAKNCKMLDSTFVRRRFGHKKYSAMAREYAKVSKCTDVLMLSPENELPPPPEAKAALVAGFEYTTLEGAEDDMPYVDAARFGTSDAIDLAIWTMHKMHKDGFDAHVKKLEDEKLKPAQVKKIGSVDTSIRVMWDAKEAYGPFVMRHVDRPSPEEIARLEQLDLASRPDTWAKLEALVMSHRAEPAVNLDDDFDFGCDVPEDIKALIEEHL